MKQRLIEIITLLRDVCKIEELEIKDETLFSESCSFLRGEKAGENRISKQTSFKKESPTFKRATSKQIAYAQQLADKKGIELKITGNESSFEISKLIESLIK